MQSVKQLEFIIFTLGNITFGIDVEEVVEVLEATEMETPPDMPDFMCGMVSFRSEDLPVIDLNKHYRLSHFQRDGSLSVIVVRIFDGKNLILISLGVDSIQAITQILVEQIEPLPNLVKQDLAAHAIWAIGKLETGDVVLLVRPERILGRDEIRMLRYFGFVE